MRPIWNGYFCASNTLFFHRIGYQRTLGANWGVSLELGGRVSNLTLSATGQEALSAADRASFEQDLADFNNDLNDFGVIPYVSLGATYRF